MNQSKSLILRVFWVAIFVQLIARIVFISQFSLQQSPLVASVSSAKAPSIIQKQKQTNPSRPVRLMISKINLDANLEYVGLLPNGAVGVPKNPANAAWYDLGPRPGDKGDAVIVGHFGRWKTGQGSVFDHLNKLIKGDRVVVKDANGVIVTFVVRDIRTYGQNENPLNVFASSDGQSHLNLITCEGIWDKTKKSYPNRLIVFTDKTS